MKNDTQRDGNFCQAVSVLGQNFATIAESDRALSRLGVEHPEALQQLACEFGMAAEFSDGGWMAMRAKYLGWTLKEYQEFEEWLMKTYPPAPPAPQIEGGAK